MLPLQADTYTYNTHLPVIHDEVSEFIGASQAEIFAEPELDKASSTYAEEHGGPLTKAFLGKVKELLSDEDYQALRIDIKSPRLVYGFSPSNSVWHCDFHFSRDPNNPTHMIRPDALLDEEARHFTLISDEPATEFWTKPSTLDYWEGEDWEEIQDELNAEINQEDRMKIPVATLVEFRGNNIHRSTTYTDRTPFVRYFIRASLFPKGHRFRGSDFRNTTRHRFAYRGKIED